MRGLRAVVTVLFVVLSAAWAIAALAIDGPAALSLGKWLAGAFLVTDAALLLRLRPWRRALAAHALLFALVLGSWLAIPARNDRDWQRDVRLPPTVRIEGDRLAISHVRNFHYRSETDFDEHWEEREYDLRDLVGADMFLSYWGSPLIAHTIMSFEFKGDKHLAISIETRKEVGESYSAVLGFFRQYELYYVVADERDLVGLRTNYRGEDVYLYRLAASPEVTRRLLLDYVATINALAVEPRWYNALSQNCTTAIRTHFEHIAASNPWNWRILVNGYLDQLGYSRGSINTELPFEELRRRSNIVERAKRAGDADDFSVAIRVGLPARPAPRAAR